jgi:benzoate membrane transport protein
LPFSALLAGVLTGFGLQAFGQVLPAVGGADAAALPGQRIMPRYAVVLTLAGGILLLRAGTRLVQSAGH